jgi:uncharacterized protein
MRPEEIVCGPDPRHPVINREGLDVERIGKFIQVYSGERFWPIDPRPEEIKIEDIAHALSNQCRFSGHSEWHYSVAQHSVLVSAFTKDPLAGLMHDASEAYLADIPRPIKPSLPQYLEIEANIMKIIGQKFGFTVPISPDVIAIDNAMLWIEKEQIMKPGLNWFQDKTVEIPEEMKKLQIRKWSPQEAETIFLHTFEQCAQGNR